MDRRRFLFNSSLLTAGFFLPLKPLFKKDAGSFTLLRRNVGYFTEKGGTIGWLASPDALAIVDSQFPESARHCLEGLHTKTGHSPDVLINTHHHGDHTSGNPVFKEVAGVMAAHENVPELMKKSEGSTDAYPSTTFSDKWKIQLGGETVHARHYGPAHTGGDAVVYFEKANVVHMGDLVFNRMNPYTDRPSGASITNWAKVLGTIEKEYPSDALYIFGHGKPDSGVTGRKEDVGVMRAYLRAMIEHVKEGMEKGKSKKEIISVNVLDGFEDFLYADFWTLPKNLDIIYSELSA